MTDNRNYNKMIANNGKITEKNISFQEIRSESQTMAATTPRTVLVVTLIFLVLMLAACGGKGDGGSNDGRFTIVATLFPQYDFARQIAGDYADVILLLPPGMESHSYDLRPTDMITIKNCDMFIYTGKYMEAWAETIADSLTDGPVIVDVSKGILLVKEEDDEDEDEGHKTHKEHHHEYDPHIWTSPRLAMIMVDNITEALCVADSLHAAEYLANAAVYKEKLEELDAAFRDVAEGATVAAGDNMGAAADTGAAVGTDGTAISGVAAPTANKTIYFGGRFAMTYFVREYGFECVTAYHDCSAESEPSIKSVMKMIDEVTEHRAKAIFYEELVDPKVARTIAEETGTELLLLHSAHNVGRKEFEEGITYLDIMWQNVANLKEGLY